MKLQINNSRIGGKGNFTNQPIKKGELILVFEGREIDKEEMYELVHSGKVSYDDPLQISANSYLLPDESCYYINHSCNPNTALRGDKELFALRPIKTGEEITYDYSATEGDDSTWIMRCNCKSKNCRGEIKNITSIPKKQIKKYLNAGGLQKYIREYLGIKT